MLSKKNVKISNILAHLKRGIYFSLIISHLFTENYETKDMNEVSFFELSPRIGYPYVYLHLGNCEHLITITDVR